jgi:hypothetical protein
MVQQEVGKDNEGAEGKHNGCAEGKEWSGVEGDFLLG